MTKTIKILGIPGSLRPGSYTKLAVEHALAGAAAEGAEVEMLDLNAFQLPFATEHESKDPEVLRLRRKIQEADGIVLGSPEYHGSLSGVLKNALDLMEMSDFDGKMVGLVGVSGGVLGASEALNALRSISRALHAWVVPTQAGVPQAWKAFTPKGELTDPALARRLREVGSEVARYTALHQLDRAAVAA